MTEKVRTISNPLTIIAIFAALAEINATVSIGLVGKELQATFIWFIIIFPTMLVIAFFLTLNFNTKVIYAPSDYKDDKNFHKILTGELMEPDREINNDKNIINKTLNDLGISKRKENSNNFNVPSTVNYLFSVRYSIEKEIRRLIATHLQDSTPRPIVMMLPRLFENNLISSNQHKVIRNIYSITTPAIHGDEHKVTSAEMEFVRQIAPGLIDELRKIG